MYTAPHRPATIRGRVAQVDGDHVRRQPELRIEHGLQHDERVAVEREEIGHEQREETDDRRDDVAQAEPVNRFEHERQQHASPADEDGRRVQIRDWRPAGDVNAGDQGERVQRKREPQQPDRRAAQRPRPADPGQRHRARTQPRTSTARVVERAELVEEDFEIDLRLRKDFRVGDTGIFQLFRAGLQYRFIIANEFAVFG